MPHPLPAAITRINGRVWLVLSLFLISVIFNAGIAPHHLVVGLYLFPTLFAAFYGGRRYALFTAAATVLLVYAMTHLKPSLFAPAIGSMRTEVDALSWAGMMMLTAYVIGTLSDQKEQYVCELRDTYHGVLLILSQFVSKDSYTENHSYRVSSYAAQIASQLGMSEDDIEDVRAAALLHDIGKLEVSRELLYKAARLTEQEYRDMMQHVDRGAEMLSPVGGSLRRVIPIVLAHHEKFDGSGPHHLSGSQIPLGACVIAVADVYDALISDRPYRKAMAPFEAKEAIQKGSGIEFAPKVVAAFVTAFQNDGLEVAPLV
jgi:putative nucleotidyltransferase with HDIG domain